MAGKTALNKEMKHLNGAYFRTISGENYNKYEGNSRKILYRLKHE